MAARRTSWCISLFLVLMFILGSCDSSLSYRGSSSIGMHNQKDKPCDEIYVVEEGETLHTISEKCGDPFIVEENPHINDSDDVFPGLVIKITPFYYRFN
ncbi:Peptidoglycan-binding lysin domain [Macleaya cordata]|uniref:Peptidoglycan-binding lysin domain n=1 Tax=Macleaya cordata TaxID=56857 RepID=A0A200Q697_MACCD|nr:Peptidoglycan-binding lysin domain [Macleaya cordata]